MNKLSPELEEILSSTFKLKNTLSSVLPPEAVEYICNLIAKDGAHRKFLELTKDDETS